MVKRIPLWLTLVPLAVGIAGYWTVWNGFRMNLASDISRALPGSSPKIGGFPYRVEALLNAPKLAFNNEDFAVLAWAKAIVVNRGPWQEKLTIVRSIAPHIEIKLSPLSQAALGIDAETAQASVHLEDKMLVRQSSVFDKAVVHFGVLPFIVHAQQLELHLRETPTDKVNAGSASPPRQVQLVLAGNRVQLGKGAPMTLTADIAFTARQRLRHFTDWADGGTAEIHDLTMADASGEVLRINASAVPQHGHLMFAGTIVTNCPKSVRAAYAGTAAPVEQRARIALRMAFSGVPGAIILTEPEPGWETRPVRAQVANCPAIWAG